MIWISPFFLFRAMAWTIEVMPLEKIPYLFLKLLLVALGGRIITNAWFSFCMLTPDLKLVPILHLLLSNLFSGGAFSGLSLSMADCGNLPEKEAIILAANKQVLEIEENYKNGETCMVLIFK